MNIQKLSAVLILSICFLNVNAQTKISGKIRSLSGDTVIGANIYIENTYDGTSSNVQGEFQFITEKNGNQKLIVSMIGFHPYSQLINCDQAQTDLNISLKEKIDKLNAVTISAGAMEASDIKKAVVMKPIDIVTTSGALGDVVGALNKLPGTATVGNDGRLFVRGGDASETNIYFDGLQVGSAYGTTATNAPTRSRFNPNLFKGSFFSTGAYSAEYGQALSSALVLNSIDRPIRNQTDISVMSIGGAISQALVGKENSLTASASFMDLSPYMSIIDQNMDFIKAPQNWDFELLGRQDIGDNGLLKAFFHTESAKVSVNQKDIDSENKAETSIHNNYHFGNVNIKNIINDSWSYYGGMSLSDNTDKISLDSINLLRNKKLAHLKLVLVHDYSDKLSYKNGIEIYQNSFQEKVNESGEREFSDQVVNHFIESDYYLNKNLVFRLGLRTSYSTLLKKTWTTPRLSLAYKLDQSSQLSFAYGDFKQLQNDEVRVQQKDLGNSEASHVILNYLFNKNGRTFRTELFNKSYDQLLQYDLNEGQEVYNFQTSGEGYARGFDLFYRDNKTIKNTDFWLSYSYIDSKRNFKNFESIVRPNYAPKHNASIVMKSFFQVLHSQLGFSYSWNSGYPFHNPNEPGEMQNETKDFQNLSISWSYLPMQNLIIHFECSNVLGNKNVFGYDYSSRPNSQGQFAAMPIDQVADRFLFLGVFLTLSKDKNANQLNNL